MPPVRLVVFLGIAFGMLLFFTKGPVWLSSRLRLRSRPLWIAAASIFLSAAIYFGLWLGVDTPGGIVIAFEFAAYLALALQLAVLLSVIGALVVVYALDRRGGRR